MREGLEPLFNPSSLALVGASRDEWKSGGMFLKSFLNHGFQGRLYPVNPRESEIMGLKAYPSVLDIPGDIDLAILAIPAPATEQAMVECARKGVRFVVIHSAGFGESGDMGRELEARVMDSARRGGVRVVGPNCMGIYSPYARLNTILTIVDVPMEGGKVAFVGQSGWASEIFIISGYDRGLRSSRVISSGNQSDLSTPDYVEYFGSDPKTEVIAAYIEGIKGGRRLLQVAAEVSRKKPIIMWKAGRTTAGARAVTSHTGSLAGSDEVYSAAFRQAGITKANHLEELIDLAVAFTSTCRPRGNRVGILVEAGGGGVAAADACEGMGLEVPPFPEETQEELTEYLREISSPLSVVRNPVDLIWPPMSEFSRILLRCVESMARAVDILLLLTYYPLDDESFAQSMVELKERIDKPIFVVPAYPSRQSQGLSLYTRKGIPAFPSAERAAKAISAAVEYRQNRNRRTAAEGKKDV